MKTLANLKQLFSVPLLQLPAVAFIRENAFEIVALVMSATIATVALSIRDVPHEPLPQTVGSLVGNFGMLVVFAYAGIKNALAFSRSMTFFIKGLVMGFMAYATALWAIGAYGDFVFKEVMAQPQGAIAVAISCLIVHVILRFAFGRREPAIALEGAGGMSARAVGVFRPAPTTHDNRATATHEAGHALIHAALDYLPHGFVAVVERNDRENSLGHVSAVNEGHLLTSRVFAEWKMLMLLGGLAAEKALLGGETLGGSSDYRMWLATVQPYLANGTRGAFHYPPVSTEEIAFNSTVIERVQREHEATLAVFFEMNADVLRDLADALLERRRLDVEALTPFMERARLPDGFPKPFLL